MPDKTQSINLEKVLSSEHNIVNSPVNKNFFHKIADSKIVESYFKPEFFEKWQNGKIYELLGVGIFKKILIGGDYFCKFSDFHPIRGYDSRKEGLCSYEDVTRTCELAYIVGLLVYEGFAVGRFAHHQLKNAAILTAVNVVANLYPLMVQRYNRTRIYNLLEKLEK